MSGPNKQRGATLLVGLVMLVVLTLLAISAMRTSMINLKIIGNTQFRQEAMSSARAALNQVFSHGSYFVDPSTAPTSINVDINGDGTTDQAVTLSRPCLQSSIAILVSELSPTNAADLPCLASSVAKNTGIMGQNLGGAESDCARVTWQVTATVNDSLSKAKVQMVEGVSLRMDRILADAYKNDSTKRCAP